MATKQKQWWQKKGNLASILAGLAVGLGAVPVTAPYAPIAAALATALGGMSIRENMGKP